MASTKQEFGYHNVLLLKSKTLGTGSYGGVCMAKCDGLLCAAKIMHPTLFDLRDPGTTSYLRRFEEECRLLSLARHPNVVQYLATYRDPETHLPVLLMELCNESLCRFLERSVGSLPYHTELNISYDIALALVYLHTNGLIHRDLTGNNVLMIAGVRAKVSDFGMSKLASVNPRMTPLTLCSGNQQYMPPEALDQPPSYTDKLDIFSFGVLLVQIMTRQFPDPGPRFQVDPQYQDDNVRVMIPETQRRGAHLQLISNTIPLKIMALNCLKGRGKERPSAQQLSEALSKMKGTPPYERSTQSGDVNWQELESLRRQIQDLQQRDKKQQEEMKIQQQEIQQQKQEYEKLQLQLTQQTRQLDQTLHEQKCLMAAKVAELQELHGMVEKKEKELQEQCSTSQTRINELQSYKMFVSQLQDTLVEKNETIDELERTVSANVRKIQQLQLQVEASNSRSQQLPHAAGIPQAASVTALAAQLNITKLRWEEVIKAPEKMWRGAAVADATTAYFNPRGSHKLYSCLINSNELNWSSLPNNPYCNSSLAIVAILLALAVLRMDCWVIHTPALCSV